MPLLGQLDTQVSKPDMRKCEEQYLAIFRCLNASGHGTMFKSDWNYLQQVLNDALGTGKDGGDTCVGRNEYEVNTWDWLQQSVCPSARMSKRLLNNVKDMVMIFHGRIEGWIRSKQPVPQIALKLSWGCRCICFCLFVCWDQPFKTR